MPIFSATIADRLGALREPNFRLFFLGQAVSRLGDGVAPVALTGLMPAIVSAGRLQEANSLRGLAASAGNIAGPALAGLLVVAFGAGWALAVDAASFGISVAFLARLRLAPHERLPPQSFLRDL